MKIEAFKFFAGLFGTKRDVVQAAASVGPADVIANPSAQPYVLQGKMKEKQLTHGETVMATMSPVRLEAAAGKLALYFCPMRELDITETLALGDGGEIRGEVVVEGLTLPAGSQSGLYTLKNVILTSNGAIQIRKTADTTWEPVEV